MPVSRPPLAAAGVAMLILITFATFAVPASAAFRLGYLSTFVGRGDISGYIATQTYVGLAAAAHELNASDPSLGLDVIWEEIGEVTQTNASLVGTMSTASILSRGIDGICASLFAMEQVAKQAYPMNVPAIGSSAFTQSLLYGKSAIPKALNWRLNLESELAQMLNFGMRSGLQCTRYGILLYEQDAAEVAAGIPDYVEAWFREQLQLAGLPDPLIGRMAINASSGGPTLSSFTGFFFQFAANPPQCVMVIGGAEALLPAVIVAESLGSSFVNMDDTYFFGSSLAAVPAFTYEGRTDLFRNVYLVTHYPPPTDMTFDAVRRYQAAMARYGSSIATPYGIPYDPRPNIYSEEGYMIMRMTAEVVRQMGSNSTAQNFMPTAFRAALLRVDDIVLGPFNDGCRGRQADAGAACECNTGTKALYMIRVNGSDGSFVPVLDDATRGERSVAQLAIPLSECDPLAGQASFSRPHMVLLPAASPAAPAMITALRAAFIAERRALSSAAASINVVDLPNGATSITSALTADDLRRRYNPVAVLGTPTSSGTTPVPPVGTPFPFLTRLMDINAGTYFATDAEQLAGTPWTAAGHLTADPVMADYIHAAASYLKAAGFGSASIIAGTGTLSTLAKNSLTTLGMEAGGQIVTASALTSAPGDGTILASQDVAVVASAITQSSGSTATIVIATSEIVLEQALAAAGASSPGANVAFVSVLQRWWGTSAAGSLLRYYRATTLGDASSTTTAPAAAMLAARVVTLLKELAAKSTGYDLIGELYSKGTIASFDVSAGPVSRSNCTGDAGNSPARTCQCGKMARRFRVHRLGDLSSATSATAPLHEYTMTTCGVQYVFPEEQQGLSAATIAIIAAAAALFVLLAIGFPLYLRKPTRNNAAAPKDASAPFAMVFTDIQSSTSLWARAPGDMSNAVEQHHALIREQVKKHKGYEVKTIGDSFMVAFTSPLQATAFALSIQAAFMDATWSEAISQTYAELAQEAREAALMEDSARELDVAKQPTEESNQDPSLWNGLRVRVGVHYGEGEIKFDEVTLGYDYYGTVVNTAARVESVGHGGQVVLTEEAMNAVGDLPGVSAVNLGPQPLRGLSEPIGLVQLLPQRLAGRQFPPLRLDVDSKVDGDAEEESQRTVDTGSVMGSLLSHEGANAEAVLDRAAGNFQGLPHRQALHQLQSHYDFAKTLLSTATEKVRRSTAVHLAERWRIPNAKNVDMKNPQAESILIARVVAKASAAYESKRRTSNTKESGWLGAGLGSNRPSRNPSRNPSLTGGEGLGSGTNSRGNLYLEVQENVGRRRSISSNGSLPTIALTPTNKDQTTTPGQPLEEP